MDYNEKKKLAAKMTLNGVINEMKVAMTTDYLACLCEIFLDAVHDIEYHTEQIAKAKAEEENNGE